MLTSVTFLRDGYPVQLNDSLDSGDLTIGGGSLESITPEGTGKYLIALNPNDNTTSSTINLSIDGSSLSTKHFEQNFENSEITSLMSP